MFVEDHCLTVLTAHIKDRFAFRMIVAGTGNVSGDFTDPEIVGDKISCIFNDLASCHHRTGNAVQSGNPGILKEFVNSLAQLTEIAGAAL